MVTRMRILALMAGMAAVTGASASELDTPHLETDAVTTQLVYEARFGGEAGVPATGAFMLLVANEGQRLHGVAPLRVEYRTANGRVLVNGMDVERTLIRRQEEEAGIGSAMGGWLPLIIVIGAAGLIAVDGQDQSGTGTGGSGN